MVQSAGRRIAPVRCRGLSGPDDPPILGTVGWHTRGNGIHSSAAGPCIGMTSLDPYKSGEGEKKTPGTSSENVLRTHIPLGVVWFVVKVTVKRMRLLISVFTHPKKNGQKAHKRHLNAR